MRRNMMKAAGGGGGGLVKSVVFDCADNYGYSSFLGIFQIDFLLLGVKYGLLPADYTAVSTSILNTSYFPSNAFDTSRPKTGASAFNSWVSAPGSPSNQRIAITFDTPIAFDSIVINNLHESGGLNTVGVQNVKIYTTTDESAISTVYNNPIPDSVLIFDSVFPIHPASNTVQDFELTLI